MTCAVCCILMWAVPPLCLSMLVFLFFCCLLLKEETGMSCESMWPGQLIQSFTFHSLSESLLPESWGSRRIRGVSTAWFQAILISVWLSPVAAQFSVSCVTLPVCATIGNFVHSIFNNHSAGLLQSLSYDCLHWRKSRINERSETELKHISCGAVIRKQEAERS